MFDCIKEFWKTKTKKYNTNKLSKKKNLTIDMHQFLGFSRLFTTKNLAPKQKKTKYLFFPGCSFPSYTPEGVENIIKYLNEKLDGGVGSLQMCCGEPTRVMGQVARLEKRIALIEQNITETEAEEVIVACQTCFITFQKYMKIPVKSLWTLIPELGLPRGQERIGVNSDIVFNIHDSCPTRNNPEIHKGVRDIMDRLGYKYEELELSGTKTMCCGLKGMALVLNPPVAKKIINNRACSSTTGFMLTYCAACRSALEIGGVDTIHLADLLFKPCYTKAQAQARNLSSVDQWKTRYKSKQVLIKESKS